MSTFCDSNFHCSVCTPGAKQCLGDTPQNCNANGQWESAAPCSSDNWPHVAAYTCTNGVCGIGACADGFTDCDGINVDGCETDFSDPATCGTTCDNTVVCTVANGTASCTNGTCGIASCTPPYQDCDNQYSNGCETNLDDLATCGTTCANKVACAVAHGTAACTSGACTIASCTAPYQDCANGYSDGCETSLNDLASCGTTCGNIVACEVAHGTASCTNGACGIASCTAPYQDCANGYSDGCETNTRDLVTCGTTCANLIACPAVPHGTASCSNGACGVASCNTGYHLCSGVCVSNASVSSCGSSSCTPCQPPANGTAVCDGVACGFTCNAGYHVNGNGCDGNVIAVSAGWANTCALAVGGDVTCWGDNSHGQIGDGTTTERPTPTNVSNLSSGVGAIGVGLGYTCALTTARWREVLGRQQLWPAWRWHDDAAPHTDGCEQSEFRRERDQRRRLPHLRPDHRRRRQVLGD